MSRADGVYVWADVLPGDEIAGGWTVVARAGRGFTLTGTDDRTGYPRPTDGVRVVRRGEHGRIADLFAAAGMPIEYVRSDPWETK